MELIGSRLELIDVVSDGGEQLKRVCGLLNLELPSPNFCCNCKTTLCATDMITSVLEHCRVSPPPGAVTERSLPLTFFDLIWLVRPPLSRVIFYEFPCSKSDFTQTIVPTLKHSLSLVLKHFFPFAANLITPSNISTGDPEIRYRDGDSVSLIFAECISTDFDHLTGNHPRETEELLPFAPRLPPGASNSACVVVSPLLAIQVTLFPNHGISIGFTNSHVVCDGNSMFNFIRAWASVAKQLSRGDHDDDAPLISFTLPLYDRSVIKDTKGLYALFRGQVAEIVTEMEKSSQTKKPPPATATKTVRATFIMSQTDIKGLKNLVSSQRPTIAYTSSFTVVCAYIWTCMAKARLTGDAVEPDETEYLGFAIDARARLDPPIPATYFGNCLAGCILKVKSYQLVREEGFVTAVEMIGEAIHSQLNNEEGVLRGAETWIVHLSDILKSSGQLLGVAGSPKFDYYNIDFGWGKPRNFNFVTEKFSLSKFKDSEGDLEIGLCLPKNEMNAFSTIFAKGLEVLELSN